MTDKQTSAMIPETQVSSEGNKNMTANGKAKIIVLGDIYRHIIVKPNPELDKEDNQGKTHEPFKAYMAYAGAPILRQMIVEAITGIGKAEFTEDEQSRIQNVTIKELSEFSKLPENTDEERRAKKTIESAIEEIKKAKTPLDLYHKISAEVSPKLARQLRAAFFIYDEKLAPAYDESKFNKSAKRLVNVLDYFPKSPDAKTDEEVLRAKEDEKYLTTAEAWPNDNIDQKGDEWNIQNQFVEIVKIGEITPRILVIYDRDLNFRDYIINHSENKLKDYINKVSLGIVIAIEEDLGKKPRDSGTIWLERLSTIVPKEAREKCVVIITADALRESGLNITVTGSLEQAVHDVVDNLHKPPLASIIGTGGTTFCEHLVVLFRENMVVYINLVKKISWIHICPEFKRTAQAEPANYGTTTPVRFSIMTTAIIKSLYRDSALPIFIEAIQQGIRLGIASCNYLFDQGFCNSESIPTKKREDMSPFDAFEDALCYERREELWKLTSSQAKKKHFQLSSLPFNILKDSKYEAYNSRRKPWNRLNVLRENERKILDNIVIRGLTEAMQKDLYSQESESEFNNESFPVQTILCPFAEFGKIRTFDPQEAQDYYGLENLLRKYVETPTWIQPLSIAVFGYPGSGKNYTVKQLIKNVTGEKTLTEKTFNLSQFGKYEELAMAFQQIQDMVVHEELPLVVFDEFDCNFEGGPLGWLKYFLAPMQDGQFLDKGHVHGLNRAIFLFTGGVYSTFKEFNEALENDNEKRKSAKLEDFISRLKGHLDIQSINDENKTKKTEEKDFRRKLRRAILFAFASGKTCFAHPPRNQETTRFGNLEKSLNQRGSHQGFS